MPGKSVTLKRDPNYWGRDLPINRGLWNFDELRFDYYRDANAYFEALQDRPLRRAQPNTIRAAGRPATTFRPCATAASSRRLHQRPAQARLQFRLQHAAADFRRHARAAGDCAAVRRRVDQPQFLLRPLPAQRELSSTTRNCRPITRPADERERALLAPFPDAVRPDVLDGTWSPPASDGSGRDRKSLREALALLDAAGYELKGTTLRERSSGRPFRFEIMVTNRDDERLALAFASNLARAGIEAQVRLVDAVQYDQRRLAFDFDMIQYRWEQSLSPGNEQSFYWGSAAADEQGSRNYMGVRSPAIDAMIAAMLAARERPDFVAAVRALDRLLDLRLLRGAAVLSSRAMGGALDLYRSIPAARRCSATSRKPGGINPNGRCNDPRRSRRPQTIHHARPSLTLDDVFRRHAQRRPDALALIDPLNRASFTDGRPHRAHLCRSRSHRDGDRRRGCATWDCRPTRSSASNCPTSSRISWRRLACCGRE